MAIDTYPARNRLSDWRSKLSLDTRIDPGELHGEGDSLTRSDESPWALSFLQDLQIDVSLEDEGTSVFATDPLYPVDRFAADTAFDSDGFSFSDAFDD